MLEISWFHFLFFILFCFVCLSVTLFFLSLIYRVVIFLLFLSLELVVAIFRVVASNAKCCLWDRNTCQVSHAWTFCHRYHHEKKNYHNCCYHHNNINNKIIRKDSNSVYFCRYLLIYLRLLFATTFSNLCYSSYSKTHIPVITTHVGTRRDTKLFYIVNWSLSN